MGTPSTLELKAPGSRDVRTRSTEPKKGRSVPCIQRTQEGILSLYICLVSTLSLSCGTNQFRTAISLKACALGRSQPRICFIPEERKSSKSEPRLPQGDLNPTLMSCLVLSL